MKTAMLVIAAALFGAVQAQAANECVIDDPTGTPLNVRNQPNGKILGALNNGVAVFASAMTKDGKWVYIRPTPPAPGKSGWVYFDHLDCN